MADFCAFWGWAEECFCDEAMNPIGGLFAVLTEADKWALPLSAEALGENF